MKTQEERDAFVEGTLTTIYVVAGLIGLILPMCLWMVHHYPLWQWLVAGALTPPMVVWIRAMDKKNPPRSHR